MASMVDNLESSLPVPSVQELVNKGFDGVPLRYILDHDIDCSTTSSLQVPLIDFSNLLNPDSRDQELQKLHIACKDWGLFQLINHGMLISDIKMRARDFFELPLHEKERYSQEPGSLEGYGHAFIVSEDQKLEWNDMLLLKALPLQDRKLKFWPQHHQNFRKTVENYAEDTRKLTIDITKYMGMALGIDGEEFCTGYQMQNAKYDVKMTCYPPCPEPEQVIGINSHADNSGITLLLECGDMAGLQVLKDGHWVYVQPLDGAIVVNIGQITEIMSNAIYKAPEHRAVVNKSKERHSVLIFCYPDSSLSVGPSKQLIESSGAPPLYKTVTLDEYFRIFYNRKLESSFIDSLKI